MTVDARGRQRLTRYVEPVGAALARVGFTANRVTVLGLLLTGVSAWLVIERRLAAAGFVLIAAGVADILDGSVARARGGGSPAGAFFDSVADRVADGAILAAITWALRADPVLFALAAVALVAAQVTSYTKAKAEAIGVECNVGLLERLERVVLIIVGLVFADLLLTPALIVLAVGATFTVLQRVRHVVVALDAREG